MEFKSVSPNFVVAGMMKAGTSALQFNLNKHPQIYCLSKWWKENVYDKYGFDESQFEKGLANKNTKETDFFCSDLNFDNGKDTYEKFFPMDKIAVGESSPNYTQPNLIDLCIDNMKGLYPNMKIIISLRDPIDRAFSHWNMIQAVPTATWGAEIKGMEFEDVIEQKPNRGMFKRGKYINYIEKYTDAFGKDNIYLVIQEELKANPITELGKIHTFLGVDTLGDMDPGYKNIFENDYGDRVLSDDAKETLRVYYSNSVEKLKAEYPDLDYSKWNSY